MLLLYYSTTLARLSAPINRPSGSLTIATSPDHNRVPELPDSSSSASRPTSTLFLAFRQPLTFSQYHFKITTLGLGNLSVAIRVRSFRPFAHSPLQKGPWTIALGGLPPSWERCNRKKGQQSRISCTPPDVVISKQMEYRFG